MGTNNTYEIQLEWHNQSVNLKWVEDFLREFEQTIGFIHEDSRLDIQTPFLSAPPSSFQKTTQKLFFEFNQPFRKPDKRPFPLKERFSQLDSDFSITPYQKNNLCPKIILTPNASEPLPPSDTKILAFVSSQGSSNKLPVLAPEDFTTLRNIVLTYFQSITQSRPLYGLVLTGGKSTRMKKDKSQLNYHGKPQWIAGADLLKPYCEKVFISCRKDQENRFLSTTYSQIHDSFLNKGPMSGILSAQSQHIEASWIVIACDLPYLEEKTIQYLLDQRNPFKLATAFKSNYDGLPEPLCAIYEPKSHLKLMQFLSMGTSCPRKVLIHTDSHLIEPISQNALDNVNHPEEFEKALRDVGSQNK